MPHDLGHDEREEFLRELGIEVAAGREVAQPGDLLRLAVGIGGGEPAFVLQFADTLGDLEPLGQQADERRVQIVDGRPQPVQFRVVLHGISVAVPLRMSSSRVNRLAFVSESRQAQRAEWLAMATCRRSLARWFMRR